MYKPVLSALLSLTLLVSDGLAQESQPAAPAAPPAPEASSPEAPPAQEAPAAASEPLKVVSPEAIVLSVGDQKFTREQFENLILALPPQLQSAARGPQKREFARQIAELFAVAAEAERRELDRAPELEMRLRYQRDNLLAGFLFQKLAEEATVSEEKIAAHYAENKGSFEEVTAKHILVRFKGSDVPQKQDQPELTEEEALTKAAALKERIAGGEAFADVAKAESDDTGSAQTGGALGTFGRGQMIAEFEKAAFEQEVGKVGEPVKTSFGYHLILVEDRKTKSIDEVRDEIAQRLKPGIAREQLKALTESKGVTLNDDYFAEPPAGSATGPEAGQ